MTRIFYDHLIVLNKIEVVIRNSVSSKEEQEELWQLIEEIVHTKVLHIILDKLPREFHNEFLEEFTKAPHDEMHIRYLNDKTGEDIEIVIHGAMHTFEEELINELSATSKRV